MPVFRTFAALLISSVLLHAAEAAYARSPAKEKGLDTPQLSTVLQADTLHGPSAAAFTPDDAAREILRRHGGRVLAVQPDGAGYRVKMLKDGEVRIYQVTP